MDQIKILSECTMFFQVIGSGFCISVLLLMFRVMLTENRHRVFAVSQLPYSLPPSSLPSLLPPFFPPLPFISPSLFSFPFSVVQAGPELAAILLSLKCWAYKCEPLSPVFRFLCIM